MFRFCRSCQQRLPIRDFDLGADRVSSVCLSCAGLLRKRSYDGTVLECSTYLPKRSQITALEQQRRPLITALMKIDSEIAGLRSRWSPQIVSLIDDLEKRRRSLIVTLVKIDNAIGDLREVLNPPPRVIVNEPPSIDSTFGEDLDDDYVPDEI